MGHLRNSQGVLAALVALLLAPPPTERPYAPTSASAAGTAPRAIAHRYGLTFGAAAAAAPEGATAPGAGPAATASDSPSLVDALTNPAVSAITITNDISLAAFAGSPYDLLVQQYGPIQISRNLQVVGAGGLAPPALDLAYLADKFQIAPGSTVTVAGVRLQRTSQSIKSSPVQLFTKSPLAVLSLSGVVWEQEACPQPSDAIALFTSPPQGSPSNQVDVCGAAAAGAPAAAAAAAAQCSSPWSIAAAMLRYPGSYDLEVRSSTVVCLSYSPSGR